MTELADKKSKIAKAFDNIGKSNGTVAPHTDSNQFAVAYEYFVADQLESAAKKRKEQAKKAAAEAGILEFKKTPGTTEMCWENELLAITAKTNNAAEKLDADLLRNELMKKLGTDEAAKLLKKCTKSATPATTISFVVK
jgi:hypothetical protein